jgi:glycosyltransferase involved in cell wall biosynthesis
MKPEPLVSVVIPTYNRPHLVGRAVRSVLSQTLDVIEVIVVVDGPDEATLQVLRQINDSRLIIKVLPANVGIGGVLNAGVNEARCQWVAFLADDDEWFPQKLELQLQTARQSHYLYPIISCRLIARSEVGDLVWPRRFPSPNESLDEYLFCRNGLFSGEGFIQPCTIFTTKELLQRLPFRDDLQRHEDIDWLLRVSTMEDVGVEFVPVPKPLVVWHIEENRDRISNRTDWRYSLSWIQANRHLVTPRAYTSFVMTWLSANAAKEGDWKAFLLLLREAYRYGKLTLRDTLLYLGIWLIPRGVRRQIAIFSARRRHDGAVNVKRRGRSNYSL